MARHFGATQLDQQVAKAVVRNASPALEWPARLLTWAADEHVLNLVAGGVAVSANGRRSGTASTAQASEAQEARMARFSCTVMSGSGYWPGLSRGRHCK
jgi:hypothetical protein